MIFWPGFAVRSGITGRSGGTCRPLRQPFQCDTQARRVRNGAKRTPDCKMKFNGLARSDEESCIDKLHKGHLRTGPVALLISWSKGRTRRRVLADRACANQANRDALRGRHRDGIMHTAAPSSILADFRKTRWQADLQTPLEGLRNAYATMKRRPIVRAGQNKMPDWRWWQSCGTCPANTDNRITGPPKPLCPL